MRWTVGRRIAAGYALALALVVVVVGVGAWALESTSSAYRSALWLETEIQEGALSVYGDVRAAHMNYLRFVLAGEEEDARDRDDLATSAGAALRELRDVDPDSESRAVWAEALLLFERWDEATLRSMAAHREGDEAAGEQIRQEEIRPLRAALQAELDRGLELTSARTQAEEEAATERSNRAQVALWIAALVGLLLGVGAALLLHRAVTGPLRDATQVVATSATQILASTTQQAAGATQSLSAVTETAATADQVAQTAEQSAERARSVASSAQRAAEIGDQGRLAVEASIGAMDTLKGRVESISESILALAEQAQAIGEIISTVNDLAEQTNLLALNASIEAARAGESGRGFAVVAGEIRSLADESKSATVRVRQILGEIQRATSGAVMAMEEGTKQADSGSRQVAEAGGKIRELVHAVDQAAKAAAQISASAGEQSAGMGQIREAIGSIQEAAEQNLEATKQGEAAAQDLTRMGSELLELVGRDERRPSASG